MGHNGKRPGGKPRFDVGKPGEQHYYICGRWLYRIKGSPLGTPPTRDALVEVYHNEAIAVHPAFHALVARQTREGYTVLWSMGITKEVHDYYRAKEIEILQEVAEKAANERGESNEQVGIQQP